MKCVQSVVTLALIGLFVSLSVGAQTTDEAIAKATLPLPEDLRAEAAVFTYDTDTGERIQLRSGANHVECRLKGDNGFTRCFSILGSARRDLAAKLTAEGMSRDERQAALKTAEENGMIKPRIFGSMSYRLYDKGDRIQLLWILSLPNATSEDLGMPTGAQRDNSLAGKGTPWMMREGTPSAHLMIPINGTELSNHP
ncbi:MAG: hypothetical protein JKY98_11210 [Gammaproteobacteria bacterium]|nr:hypothetical protein [Gammaproteobacteria bacterium]